jgi:hypothetical protein
MISTRDLSGLPDINQLRRLMQSLAALDAVLSPEWQYRYFSFNIHWASGDQLGSMRNGQGDDLFAVFDAAGCWIKGFNLESAEASREPSNLVTMFTGLPKSFERHLSQPAFSIADTTFSIWREFGSPSWSSHRSRDRNDGSGNLLQLFDGKPETYRDWAESYYEVEVSINCVNSVYAHQIFDAELLTSLNPGADPAALCKDLDEIGYPHVAAW